MVPPTAVCPFATADPKYLDWYREGGVTTLAPTLGGTEGARPTLDLIAKWLRLVRERSDLLLVRRADDILEAKRSGRLGIYWHLQGTEPIEDNWDLVSVYKSLGVGMIQLTYNVRNRVGDGCEERTNAGLSRFGIKLVHHCNEAGVIVDCSHTGLRTSLDAIESSSAPVVLSHSNVAAVTVSARTIVQRVGVDHVGLGIDYYDGQAGVASDEVALQAYHEAERKVPASRCSPDPSDGADGGGAHLVFTSRYR